MPTHTGIGYVAEIYHELAMKFEITDSALEPIEGAWLNSKTYRSITVYSSEAEARAVAERLLQFLDFAHLQVKPNQRRVATAALLSTALLSFRHHSEIANAA